MSVLLLVVPRLRLPALTSDLYSHRRTLTGPVRCYEGIPAQANILAQLYGANILGPHLQLQVIGQLLPGSELHQLDQALVVPAVGQKVRKPLPGQIAQPENELAAAIPDARTYQRVFAQGGVGPAQRGLLIPGDVHFAQYPLFDADVVQVKTVADDAADHFR